MKCCTCTTIISFFSRILQCESHLWYHSCFQHNINILLTSTFQFKSSIYFCFIVLIECSTLNLPRGWYPHTRRFSVTPSFPIPGILCGLGSLLHRHSCLVGRSQFPEGLLNLAKKMKSCMHSCLYVIACAIIYAYNLSAWINVGQIFVHPTNFFRPYTCVKVHFY